MTPRDQPVSTFAILHSARRNRTNGHAPTVIGDHGLQFVDIPQEVLVLTPVLAPLEVLAMPKQNTIKQMKCPSELEAMSLRAYLVAEGVENVQLDGRQVTWGKSIPLGVFEAWCGQYPTPVHQLAQLRAIALPILRRAA